MKCETYDYCQNPTQKDILHFKYCDWKKHMMPLVGKNGEPQAGAEIAFNDNFVKQPYKTSIIDRIKELPNWQDYPIIWSYIGYEFKYDWTRTIPGVSSCVDIEFLREVVKISHKLGIDPDDLMAVMAFESWFNPAQKNLTGGTAIGICLSIL